MEIFDEEIRDIPKIDSVKRVFLDSPIFDTKLDIWNMDETICIDKEVDAFLKKMFYRHYCLLVKKEYDKFVPLPIDSKEVGWGMAWKYSNDDGSTLSTRIRRRAEQATSFHRSLFDTSQMYAEEDLPYIKDPLYNIKRISPDLALAIINNMIHISR